MKLFFRITLLATMILYVSSSTLYACQDTPVEEKLHLESCSPAQLNELATLLYEQYYFFETFVISFAKDRPAHVRSDILDAYDEIRSHCKTLARNYQSCFDENVPQKEQAWFFTFYSTLRYLTTQETFAKVVATLPRYSHLPYLRNFCSLIDILSSFVFENKQADNKKIITYCKSISHDIAKIGENYSKESKIFHLYYMLTVATLRSKINPKTGCHLTFHRYLDSPKKLLPSTLLPPIQKDPKSAEPQKITSKDAAPDQPLEDIDLIMKRFETKKQHKKDAAKRAQKKLHKKEVSPLAMKTVQADATTDDIDKIMEQTWQAFEFQDKWLSKLAHFQADQGKYVRSLIRLTHEFNKNKPSLDRVLHVNDLMQDPEEFRDLQYIRAILMHTTKVGTDLYNPNITEAVQSICLKADLDSQVEEVLQ